MTLGAKIREARRKCGFSQEQLAQKMSVSRSAVAKWETDKGLPDVGNLKVLARLLRVSVDELLDEEKTVRTPVIRQPYNLSAYGSGCKKMKKDRAVRSRFPNARIYTLYGRQNPVDAAMAFDPGQDCSANRGSVAQNPDKAFYLVEEGRQQFFVTLTDTFIEIRVPDAPLRENAFCLEGWSFIRSNYEITAPGV